VLDKTLSSIKNDLNVILTTLHLPKSKFKVFNFFKTLSPESGIAAADSFPEMLKAVADAEQHIYKQINHILRKFNKNKPLAEQEAILMKLQSPILALVNLNKILIRHATFFRAHQENPTAETLISKFRIDHKSLTLEAVRPINQDVDIESLDASNVNSFGFLRTMFNAIIISLLKADVYPPGSDFIKKLADTLQNKAHMISMMLNYKVSPSSLELSPDALEAYARKISQNYKNKSLKDQIKGIQKNIGASSSLVIPVWPEKEEDFEKSYGIYFKEIFAIEKAMENLIGGSFSFDKNGNLFYTPFHLEILHELIHSLHNSRGTNREHLRDVVPEEIGIWKDAEEYWTIAGGNMSENFLNKIINAPLRFGHNGFSASAIMRPEKNEELLAASPRQLFKS
jgi:hypothetical protein